MEIVTNFTFFFLVKMHVYLPLYGGNFCAILFSFFFVNAQKIEVVYPLIINPSCICDVRCESLFFTFEFSTTLLTFLSHNYKNHLKTKTQKIAPCSKTWEISVILGSLWAIEMNRNCDKNNFLNSVKLEILL